MFHARKGIIKAKDKKYYTLYIDIKAKKQEENKDWTKGHCDGVASNRIQTLIAKEIYTTFKV